MRKLKGGVGLLVQNIGATVLPIAIIGSHRVVPNSRRRLWTHFNFWAKDARVIMVVGEPMTFDSEMSRKEVTEHIAQALLKLIAEALN